MKGTVWQVKAYLKTLKHLVLLTLVISLANLQGCSTNPITERRQLKLVPNSQLFQMSYATYDEMLKQNKIITGTPEARRVAEVGQRIKNAVEQYLTENGMEDRLDGYEWEFHLIDDPSANAFALPGGKVAVHTGILPIAQNEAGLATVMGHEVAHAIAGHGNERMSQGLLLQFGGIALDIALRDKPAATRNLFLSAYGLGATVGAVLPFSRLHEAEADEMGLIFMALAEYDPRSSIAFWERMASQGKDGPPEFLSTHPTSETRIAKLQEHMPRAVAIYKQERERYGE